MIRLIASDMDETFLNGEHAIPPANIEALRRLRELGVLFVPCSGRPWHSVRANFESLDRDLLADSYIISFNGGFINRFDDSEPLTSAELDVDVARELYERGFATGRAMHVYTASGTIYVQNLQAEERRYVSGLSGIVELPAGERSLAFAAGEPIVKVLYVDTDPAALRRLAEQIRPRLDASLVAFTYSSRRYLEFMPAGVDKGTGLVKLAGLLGCELDQTMAVGDSANDIAMLDVAGVSVGVANVTDDTRPHCAAVLDADADRGALPELVERFIEPEHH